MASRTVSIDITGTNASAIRALAGTSAAASKAGADVESKMGGAATKVGGAFSKLDSQLGKFGLPFAGALGALGGKLEQTETKTKSFGSSVSSLGGAELAGAAVGLAVVGGEALKMADTFDQAHARLATAAQNVGESMASEGSAISATDDKLTALGFKSSDTEAALAALVPATHDVGAATELMGTAADLARFKNESLGTATQTLVAIEGGRLKGLASLGISSKDAAGKTIDVATAVQRVTDAVSGQGTAYLGTYAGQQAKLAAEAEKLGVALGETEKKALVDVQKTALSGVETFQSFNSATDGVLGKVAAVAVALPAAAFAAKKLWAAGSEVVDVFGKIGSGVGNVVSGLGNLIGPSDAAATAEAVQATSTDAATAALNDKAVSLAIVGVAEDKEAAATATRVAAEEALNAAVAGGVASDAEIVSASSAVTAARVRETAATEAATAAREASAGAAGPEVVGATAGVGLGTLAAASAPIVATAGAIALAIKGGDDLDKTMRNLADALVAGGTAATDASSKFAHILGPTAAADLNKYAIAAISGGSASEQAANKAKILSDAFVQAGLTTTGYTKVSDQYTQTASSLREQVDAATGAIDKLTKKYGEAGVQTLQLSAAQKTYADDLASGHASAATLASDKANVISLSTKQATTQNAVNDATNAGTDAANKNTAASQAQAAALQAVDDKLKHLNDDTLAAAGSALALQQANLSVGDAAQTYAEKLLALKTAKAGDTQASRDAQSASISLQQSILSGVSAAEADAKAHVDLTSKATGTALAIEEENAKHAAAKQELDVLAFTYPALAADIDVYRKTLDLIPATKHTDVTVSIHQAVAAGLGPAGFQGPARAEGGPVSAATPYLVGERGPEIFQPGVAGTIIPHDKIAAPGSAPRPSLSALKVFPTGSLPAGGESSSALLTKLTEIHRELANRPPTTFANQYHINAQGTPTVAEIEYTNRVQAWQLTRSGRR